MVRLDISQLVDEKTAEHLLCAVCLQVPEDPKIASCASEHMFCKECINPIFLAGESCPCCRGEFEEIRSVPQALKSTLERINWSCKYKENGCGFVGPAEAVKKHQPQCPEILLTCPVPNCNKTMKRDKLTAHLTDDNEEQQRVHQRLLNEERDKVWADPDKESLVRVLRFPEFEKRIEEMSKGDRHSLQSAEFSFQGERFFVELFPKGDDASHEGQAGIWICRSGGGEGKGDCESQSVGENNGVTVSVCVVNGESYRSEVKPFEFDEQGGTSEGFEGWSDFCPTQELIRAARRGEEGALLIRLRLSAPARPLLAFSTDTMGPSEETARVVVNLEDLPSRVASGSKYFYSDTFQFQSSSFRLITHVPSSFSSRRGGRGGESDEVVSLGLQSRSGFRGCLSLAFGVRGRRDIGRHNFFMEFEEEGPDTVWLEVCRKRKLLEAAEGRGGSLELFVCLKAIRKAKDAWSHLEVDSDRGGDSSELGSDHGGVQEEDEEEDEGDDEEEEVAEGEEGDPLQNDEWREERDDDGEEGDGEEEGEEEQEGFVDEEEKKGPN